MEQLRTIVTRTRLLLFLAVVFLAVPVFMLNSELCAKAAVVVAVVGLILQWVSDLIWKD